MKSPNLSAQYTKTIGSYEAVIRGEMYMLSSYTQTYDEDGEPVHNQFASTFVGSEEDPELACQQRLERLTAAHPQYTGSIITYIVDYETVASRYTDLLHWIAT